MFTREVSSRVLTSKGCVHKGSRVLTSKGRVHKGSEIGQEENTVLTTEVYIENQGVTLAVKM